MNANIAKQIISELEKITGEKIPPYRFVKSTAKHFIDEDDGLVSIPTTLIVFEHLDLLLDIRTKLIEQLKIPQLTNQLDLLISQYKSVYKSPFIAASLTPEVKNSLLKATNKLIESLKNQL